MPCPARLEDFETGGTGAHHGSSPAHAATDPNLAAITPDMVEAARMGGYESGYRAGWDDATRSQAEDQTRIGAELARNLEDLGFTYHEARSHVLHSLEPVLSGMIQQVLPRLVSESFSASVLEEVLALAAQVADTPIEVVVHPGRRAALEAMIARVDSIPLIFAEEPTLAENQVYLRSGQIEREVDFAAVVEDMATAVRGFVQLTGKAFENG